MKDFKHWFRRRRIGVLLGGSSAERPISLKTGHAIYQSLKRQGYQVFTIDTANSLEAKLKKNKINFAYIALHGPGGEDGQIQSFLEWLHIPYTGSRVMASAVAMDKAASKRVFEEAHLPTAPWYTLQKPLESKDVKSRLKLPVVVKPASQGSAVGISVVKKPREWRAAIKTAFRYDHTVVVEKFLQGKEITVGVLGLQVLPVIEILPQHDRPFYDFHAKYAPGGSRHILPARIPSSVSRRAQRLALAACKALGTRGAARVDLIVDRRMGPSLLEVNTIPGMTETSLLPEAALAAGISFDTLVIKIAEHSIGK